MMKPALNKRISAAATAAVFKIILAFIFFSSCLAMLFADRVIEHIFPFRIAFVDSSGRVFLCLFLWLLVSGAADCVRISLAREIEDKLYAAPLSVKSFADNRNKHGGEKRLIRDISSLRKIRLFTSVTILDDCIVFERGKNGQSRPLMLMAEKGMCFSEGSMRRDFFMTFTFCAMAVLQMFLLGQRSAAAVSLVFAVLALLLSKKSRAIIYKKEAAAPPVIIEVDFSGDNAADALIEEGREHLRELARLDALIMDKPLSKNIADICAATRQLLELLSQSPEKYTQAKQLIEYALPTTVKLIKQYDYLERQPVKGGNIKKSMDKIVEMSASVTEIMQRELDALYADKTIDIEVDIEVLKSMVHQDMDIMKGGE